jgi:hypothetical protein
VAIEVDDSRWPLVVIRWPEAKITDADVDAFLATSRGHLARKERFVSLHDGVRATGLDGKQRKVMADHVTAHRDALARWHVAAAIVVASPVLRGVITAVNWLAPPPFPQQTFATLEEGERWLREMLARKADERAAP